MKEKDFDKIISDRMTGYESRFSDNIWSNIEQELDKKPGIRPLPYLAARNILLLSSLMVILTAVGYNLYTTYSLNAGKSQQQDAKEQINTQWQSASDEIADVDTPAEIRNSDGLISSSAAVSGASNTKTDAVIANTQSNNSFSYSANTNRNQISGYNSAQNSSVKTIGVVATPLSTDAASDESAINGQNFSTQNSVISSLMKQRIMSVSSSATQHGPVFGLIPDPKGSCPKFRTNVPEYFLELFMSPDYHNSYLSTDDVEMAGYLDSRNNSETALPGYSAGLRAGMIFRNGLTVKTGMTYSRINYRFDYQKEDLEVLKYKVVPSDTIHGNGTVAYVYDTIAYVEKGIRTVRHYNSLSSIEVPFWLGYQKDYLRWTLGFNAGASIQVLNMKSGKVLSTSSPFEPIEFSDEINGHYDLYKRSFGIGILGSAQFGYKLTPNYELMAEPYLKYYPSSITVGEYPLRQRMLVYGINIGLKLKI